MVEVLVMVNYIRFKNYNFYIFFYLKLIYYYPNGNFPIISTSYFLLTLIRFEATVPFTTAICSAGFGAGNTFLNLKCKN